MFNAIFTFPPIVKPALEPLDHIAVVERAKFVGAERTSHPI
jgi:hypothetical protein